MVFPTSFVGTALFPQGLWEQEIGSLLAVPTNLWEQLFPQRLWEHQMGVSHWLFPQICRNGILCLILRGADPKSWNRKIPNGRIFLFTDFCPPPSVEICAKIAVKLFHVIKTNTKQCTSLGGPLDPWSIVTPLYRPKKGIENV